MPCKAQIRDDKTIPMVQDKPTFTFQLQSIVYHVIFRNFDDNPSSSSQGSPRGMGDISACAEGVQALISYRCLDPVIIECRRVERCDRRIPNASPLPHEAEDKFKGEIADGDPTATSDVQDPFCSGISVPSAEPGVFVAHVPGMKV